MEASASDFKISKSSVPCRRSVDCFISPLGIRQESAIGSCRVSRGILVPSVDLAQNARRPLRQWADWFADFLAQLLSVSLLKKGLQGHPGSPTTYLALG